MISDPGAVQHRKRVNAQTAPHRVRENGLELRPMTNRVMTNRVMAWAAVAWIALWLTPYLYAVNDLITWR